MARKFSILAGSKEICSEKISGIFIGYLVGPIIHCSPDLTKVELRRMMVKCDKWCQKNKMFDGGYIWITIS